MLVLFLALVASAGVWLIWHGTRDVGSYEAAPTPAAEFSNTDTVPPRLTPSQWRTAQRLGPNRLYIPSLKVNAPVAAVGVSGGQMRLPAPDVTVVGRLTDQPTLGSLYAGHVSYNGVRGALYPLYRTKPGAWVFTSDAAGRRQAWTVTGLRVARKEPLLGFAPVADAGSPVAERLTVVTCGGPVTLLRLADGRRIHSYRDNVVLVADRVPWRTLRQEQQPSQPDPADPADVAGVAGSGGAS